jgi:hypothetical protein
MKTPEVFFYLTHPQTNPKPMPLALSTTNLGALGALGV